MNQNQLGMAESTIIYNGNDNGGGYFLVPTERNGANSSFGVIQDQGITGQQILNSATSLVRDNWPTTHTWEVILVVLLAYLFGRLRATVRQMRVARRRENHIRDHHDEMVRFLVTQGAGKDGKDGQDGADGIDGKDGQDGADGIDGKDGQDGADGVDGQDGDDGADGIDGKDGRDGRDYGQAK